MIIRTAELKDALGLQQLYSQLNPDDPHVSLDDFTEKLKRILCAQHLKLFVAEAEGSVVASCYLNIIENLTRNLAAYAVIENVVTEAQFRRQGYGKAVVKYAISEAWALGCYKVMLSTGSKQESTMKFYEGCGFLRGQKTAFLAKPDASPAY
jgi:GNAT superfamily N-acetyltransferase